MKLRCMLGHRCRLVLSKAIPCLILLAALLLALPAFCGPIHDAARDGNLVRVKALLKSNPKLLQSRDEGGETALHWAAFWGRIDVANFLLANGADLHARDNAGRIPLDYALAHGRDEMVALLRKHEPATQMAGVSANPAHNAAPVTPAPSSVRIPARVAPSDVQEAPALVAPVHEALGMPGAPSSAPAPAVREALALPKPPDAAPAPLPAPVFGSTPAPPVAVREAPVQPAPTAVPMANPASIPSRAESVPVPEPVSAKATDATSAPAAPPAVRAAPVGEAPVGEEPFPLPLEVGSATAWTRVRIDFPQAAPQALLVRLGAPLYELQMAGLIGQRGGTEPMLWNNDVELVIGASVSAPPEPLASGGNSGTLNSLLASTNGTVKTSLNGIGWPAFVAQGEGLVAGPNGKPVSLLTAGAILSENMLGDLTFDSDPSFPLTFRLVRGQGLVYLCGRGTVTAQGVSHAFGQHPEAIDWAARLRDGKTVLEREGAAQSIGWLHDTKLLQPLIDAMTNPRENLAVRRSAIEAAGRLQDPAANPALEALSANNDPRIAAIARWSLKQIELAR
jgi:hypothetical protein